MRIKNWWLNTYWKHVLFSKPITWGVETMTEPNQYYVRIFGISILWNKK